MTCEKVNGLSIFAKSYTIINIRRNWILHAREGGGFVIFFGGFFSKNSSAPEYSNWSRQN